MGRHLPHPCSNKRQFREADMAIAKSFSLERDEARFGWKLILPAIIVIGGLIIYPILYNIYLRFFAVKMAGDNILIGTANYSNVLTDPTFWGSVATTFIYVFVTTANAEYGLVHIDIIKGVVGGYKLTTIFFGPKISSRIEPEAPWERRKQIRYKLY